MSILRHSQSVSLAHRYWNNLWSHERNRAVYGSSSSPEGVGSNLRVEAEVATETEFDFAPVAAKIRKTLDHRTLFEDISELAGRPCTLESIAGYLGRELFATPLAGQAEWRSLTLWELDRYAVRVAPGSLTVEFLLQYRNLSLCFHAPVDAESQLAVSRVHAERVLDQVFARFASGSDEGELIWLKHLFLAIRTQLPALVSLAVDLGSHKLTTQSTPSDNPGLISGHWPGDVYEEQSHLDQFGVQPIHLDRM